MRPLFYLRNNYLPLHQVSMIAVITYNDKAK